MAKNMERMESFGKANNVEIPLKSRHADSKAGSGGLAVGVGALVLAGACIGYINSQVGSRPKVPALAKARSVVQRFNSAGFPIPA